MQRAVPPSGTTAGRAHAPQMVRVWDPFVRIFHWSLVALFGFAYATGDVWDDLHEAAGYAIGALVLARIVWGFVGPAHARFRDFIYGPSTILRFLRDSLALGARRYLGHNPAGGAMVVALLAMIVIICLTGVMMGLDAFWGEEWVEDVHVLGVWGTLGLIVLHLLGVVLASIEHSENLVRAMFTGLKRRD